MSNLASVIVNPQAIRIDGEEVLRGKRHADLLTDYMIREGLTIDQTDAMIAAGRIELGWLQLTFLPDDEKAAA